MVCLDSIWPITDIDHHVSSVIMRGLKDLMHTECKQWHKAKAILLTKSKAIKTMVAELINAA